MGKFYLYINLVYKVCEMCHLELRALKHTKSDKPRIHYKNKSYFFETRKFNFFTESNKGFLNFP